MLAVSTLSLVTQYGPEVHVYMGRFNGLSIVASGNGLSSVRSKAMLIINTDVLSIDQFGTIFNGIWIMQIGGYFVSVDILL